MSRRQFADGADGADAPQTRQSIHLCLKSAPFGAGRWSRDRADLPASPETPQGRSAVGEFSDQTREAG